MVQGHSRRRVLGLALAAAALDPATSSATVGPRTADAAAVRRWRQYVAGRYGQVHFFSAEPAAAPAAPRPPLVCLHPSPTSGEMYAALQGELAADRVVHCPDTPGYGASDPPPAKPTIADYGGALAEAIAALAVRGGQVDLFGFHTGSLCAIEVARQRPGLVRRLVLSGVPHYGDPVRRERERRAHVQGYPYFEDPDYVARLYRRLVLEARDSGTPEARLRRFGDRLRAGLNGWWGPDAVFSYDSAASLPALQMPTLLIAFDEEMTEPTREAARLVPRGRLVEMLDLPIFGFIVDPPRVAAQIREFLDAPAGV
jgi:pimeloyl-ACP methyl ester carboxylesterase